MDVHIHAKVPKTELLIICMVKHIAQKANYVCVYVRARVRACLRACVRACMHVCFTCVRPPVRRSDILQRQ